MNSFLSTPLISLPANLTSSQPFVQLPTNLLEAFIPGYSTISRLLLETFGFDITLLVSIAFFIFALIKSFTFLKSQLFSFVIRFGTCDVQIASDVDTYFWVMEWMAHRGIGHDSHSLIAVPPSRRHQDIDFSSLLVPDTDPTRAFVPPSGHIRDRQPQRYQTSLGMSEYFWYKGTLFMWYRQRELRRMTSQGFDMPTSLIEGRLFCLGRTTKPIKALIEEASAEFYQRGAKRTTIRRPAPRRQRKEGGNVWKTAARRQSRPLDSVVLRPNQKEALVADIHEYMKPSSRKWYAERGIPYRRGYLFHGHHGTGKTSLSFALAGYLSLDVYCLSLAEPSITEEDLIELFDELPDRCLVLLEDIDSAGLTATRDAVHLHRKQLAQQQQESNHDDTDGLKMNNMGGHISLSGLLNVIDGVASQEGRLLIMTTNHVDALDKALLRPGRVDVRIHFDMATSAHAENMFLQAFTSSGTSDHDDSISDVTKDPTLEEKESEERVRKLARTFSSEIPEGLLSPAEVQGFLMNWKRSPEDAIANVREWIGECTIGKTLDEASRIIYGSMA